MFSLEQSIAEWRRQMLAAGIKAPIPLDELEAHLREEIERQMRLGLDEQGAFEAAVSQVGKGAELKMEFAKDNGLLGILEQFTSLKSGWLMGLFWIALCSWVFRGLFTLVVFNLIGPFLVPMPIFIFAASYVVI